MGSILERFKLTPDQPTTFSFVLDYIAKHSVEKVNGGYEWKFDDTLFEKLGFTTMPKNHTKSSDKSACTPQTILSTVFAIFNFQPPPIFQNYSIGNPTVRQQPEAADFMIFMVFHRNS